MTNRRASDEGPTPSPAWVPIIVGPFRAKGEVELKYLFSFVYG